jgi:hypothetical protein
MAGAADEPALALLDNDGAPLAVTWPQLSDSQDHSAIRGGCTAKLAESPGTHRGFSAGLARAAPLRPCPA